MKILFHPLNAPEPEGKKFGDQHAKNLLEMPNNGGWYEVKKENQTDDVDAAGNKGKAKKPKA